MSVRGMMARTSRKVGRAADMIAATLITPGYEACAALAIERVRRHLGLDVVALHCSGTNGYFRKFDLPELLSGKTVLFFDADWVPVRPVNVTQFIGTPDVIGVHDKAAFGKIHFPRMDADAWGLPRERYVNTGFLIWDNDNELHRRAFALARELHNQSLSGNVKPLVDVTEQSWLNIAWHLLGVTPRLLPVEWNYFFLLADLGLAHPPENIIGLHAAGVPRYQKFKHLTDFLHGK